MPAAEKQEMWELFQEMDSDASGLLEREEVSKLAYTLGRLLSERDLSDAMGLMDKDGSGGVDFPEFLTWWLANKNEKGKWCDRALRISSIAFHRLPLQLSHRCPQVPSIPS